MSLKLEMFDADTANPEHGPRGPGHAAGVEVDYDYQAEQWVQDTSQDRPKFVRWELYDAETNTLLAKWERRADKKVVMIERSPAFRGEWAIGVAFP